MKNKPTKILNSALVGAMLGGFLGATFFSSKYGTILFPGFASVLAFIPATAPGAIVGILLGGGIGGFFGLTHRTEMMDKVKNSKDTSTKSVQFKLRSEQLEITKKLLRTGGVKVHKEISIEKKSITVPITRESLVIEKTVFDGNVPHHVETLRIPIRDEHVEVFKRPVLLGEASIYRRRFQAYEHVEEVLKKERVRVEVDGDCIVVDNELDITH